nr:MAG TPA: hypothetical protein [Caudoviricetes sp.]
MVSCTPYLVLLQPHSKDSMNFQNYKLWKF